MKLRSPLTLTLALLAAGCAALPPAQAPGAAPQAPQVAAKAKAGLVTVDVSQLIQFLGSRHVLADGFNTSGITNLRLEARGPGMDTVTSSNMTFTNPPSGSLTLEVPQGVNRIFRLQGVDANGNVLCSLATIANVPSTAPVPLSFDLATTAAANVMRLLVDPIQEGETDAAGIRTLVQSQDITDDVKTYVLKATKYDSTTKAVLAGGIDPRFFRAGHMVRVLYKSGLKEIQPKKSSASPSADPAIQLDSTVTQGTNGKLFVAIRNSSGLPVMNDANVSGEIFDLGRNGNTSTKATGGTDDSGALTFSDVNVGNFDVKLTLSDGSVAWLHDVQVRDTGASYATYAVPSTAAALPQAVNLTASQVDLTENPATHDLLLAWVDDSSTAHVREYDKFGLPKGADVSLSSPSGCNAISASYLTGGGTDTGAYLVSWVTMGGSEVDVGVLKAGATGLAKSTSHSANSASYGVQVVPLGGQDAAVVWADGSNVNVAHDTWDGVGLANKGQTNFVSTGNTTKAVGAGSSTSNFMLAWNDGKAVVTQRTALSSSGAFMPSGSSFTVSDNVPPVGSTRNLDSLTAAWDSTLNQLLLGWGTTTFANKVQTEAYGLLRTAEDPPTSKLTFQAVLPALSPSGVAFDINKGDKKLESPRLAYVSARSEYILSYVNADTHALQLQRIPGALGTLPTAATLVSTGAEANRPTSPAVAFSGGTSSYRAAWFIPGAESSSGTVTLGEYKP